MVQARFLVVHGPSRRHPGELPPGRSQGPAGGPVPAWVSWLLLGGNNRELGRGCVPFVDPDECRSAIDALVAAATELRSVVTADVDSSFWRWRVESAGAPVAAGGRQYHRRRECAYALELFLVALPGATAPAGPPRSLGLTWEDWARSVQAAVGRTGIRTSR